MDNEIVEASLIAFDSFVKKCPKEITKHIPTLLDTVTKLISYDPNYTYDHDADMGGDDDEDEGGWGSDFDDDEAQVDDDDTSWKVRRAAIKVVDSIVRTRPEMLREIYDKLVGHLVDRFKERDENVKCDVFGAFQSVMKSTQQNDHKMEGDSLALGHQNSLNL